MPFVYSIYCHKLTPLNPVNHICVCFAFNCLDEILICQIFEIFSNWCQCRCRCQRRTEFRWNWWILLSTMQWNDEEKQKVEREEKKIYVTLLFIFYTQCKWLDCVTCKKCEHVTRPSSNIFKHSKRDRHINRKYATRLSVICFSFVCLTDIYNCHHWLRLIITYAQHIRRHEKVNRFELLCWSTVFNMAVNRFKRTLKRSEAKNLQKDDTIRTQFRIILNMFHCQ